MSELVFDVLQARAERYAAAPTVTLSVRISETTGEPIHSIALKCQVRIEPRRRRYTTREAQALRDLFGEQARWGETLKAMQWTNVALMVPSFRGNTEVEIPIACTYDLEVAWANYLNSLEEGEVSILTLYSGTIFTKGATGFSVEQVPWHKEARFMLPVSVIREAMDRYFPNSGWIRLPRETLHDLRAFKGRRGLATWESVMQTLLAEADGEP